MGEELGDDVRLVVLAGWGFGLYLAGRDSDEVRKSHAIDAVTGAPSTWNMQKGGAKNRKRILMEQRS